MRHSVPSISGIETTLNYNLKVTEYLFTYPTTFLFVYFQFEQTTAGKIYYYGNGGNIQCGSFLATFRAGKVTRDPYAKETLLQGIKGTKRFSREG